MGKILSGILSKVSGKVAGVVGGSWKDVAYLRAYVKPANPNTAAQQVQRTKFSDAVEFSKPLVGPVFNAYTDRFQKSMSGFNFFIKRNIDIFDGSPDYDAIKLTEGTLAPIASPEMTRTATTFTISFSVNYGNNGLATDKMFAAVYRPSNGVWYFAAAEVDRSTQTIDVEAVSAGSTTDFWGFLWPNQYIGTVLNIIGNASPVQGS